MFYFDEYDSPVGMLTIASDGQAVCGLWLDGQKYHGATIPEEMTRKSDADGFAELRAWLDAYFVGAPQSGTIPSPSSSRVIGSSAPTEA